MAAEVAVAHQHLLHLELLRQAVQLTALHMSQPPLWQHRQQTAAC